MNEMAIVFQQRGARYFAIAMEQRDKGELFTASVYQWIASSQYRAARMTMGIEDV